MIQIRNGVFETNSSSTHSLCIVTAEEMSKLNNGELYISNYGDTLYTLNEAVQKAVYWHNKYGNNKVTVEEVMKMSEEERNAFLSSEEIVTFENWGRDDLEYFEETYTTPGGEEIVVFGEYGYDG